MAMSGFKNFVMRGNLVQLAVAVVIGTQFSNLVKQFVQSFINPLLSLAGGKPQFRERDLHGPQLQLCLWRVPDRCAGVPDLRAGGLLRPGGARHPPDPAFERNQAATNRDCPECTMSIPVAARRCPECTADKTPGTERPQQVSA